MISLYWHTPLKQTLSHCLQRTPQNPSAIPFKMTTRQLFSQLPAELRNEVYAHLSTSTTASTQDIPLPLKEYTSAHTCVQICVVHHGSKSLLTLGKYGFLEGEEYRSWLLGKDVEVWVSVHFLGHLNTFVQKDWDAKILASLRKLGKKYPWLKNVARYRIRIGWEPKLDSLARAPRGISGEIADAMVKTLVSLQDPRVREKMGDVRVEFCIAAATQVETWVKNVHLGLETFLSGSISTHEIRSATAPRTDILRPGLRKLPIETNDKKSVHWADNGARLIMRSVKEGGKEWREVRGGAYQATREWQWMAMLRECGGVEDAVVVEEGDGVDEQVLSDGLVNITLKRRTEGQ